ncbi:nitric oxide synthase-interacting protein homolog [Myzus persicae]|uniref:nitric oxide synthase-interacting protein homolog n=1 Tax=Myzus persicae TaxID=13164 RepID=UPI000B9395E2|nr:nitric oxide synthase-interacting protein homolog [Myzus persicae]XP_022169756.1 nitric oxide synthase-interacting protein homolog [Myzus persicae]XP_022169757.1 nitric oxide synthase-interacting protein homolog [Myzus persicae]
MTRHARNCTAGAVYTYHEKQKDASQSGYGTQNERVGKDSIKSFDCCSLTLQPCRTPIVSPEGHLFDKEALLQYMITKKTEYCRKLKEYEKQKHKEEEELAELGRAEQQSKVNDFLKRESMVKRQNDIYKMKSQKRSEKNVSSISNMANGLDKQLPSFWVPSETPDANKAPMSKPDKTIYCPMSGRPLKLKNFVDVKWTLVNDPSDKKSLAIRENRYMCAVTHDILSNAVPAAVIRTTGHVITMECFEKLIKKDWLHPLNGDKLTEKDIIPLQRGGTGYATTNVNLQGKNARPVLQA